MFGGIDMKRILIAILTAALMFSLCACGTNRNKSTVTNQDVETSNEDFSKILYDLNEEIYQQSVLLSNIGNYINSYWKTLDNMGGTLDPEKAIQNGYKWLSEKSEYTEKDISDNDIAISELYKNMLKASNKDALLNDICSRLQEQYTTYTKLYQTVTSPSGSRNDFIDDFNDSTGSITAAYEAIKGLLK